MATLLTPVSGPFLGNWGGFTVGLGTQSDDGYDLSCTVHGQEINASDAFGMTLIEGIYRGQDWKVATRGLEWKSGALLTAHQMFGTTATITSPGTPAANLTPTLTPAPLASAASLITNVGDQWTAYAKVLLLTAILTGGITVPLTLTATYAALSPNFRSSYNLTSKLRELPLEWSLFPYTVTNISASKIFALPFTTT